MYYCAVAFTSVKRDSMIVVCHRKTREEAEARFREIASKRKKKFVDAYVYEMNNTFHIDNANYLTIREVLAMK